MNSAKSANPRSSSPVQPFVVSAFLTVLPHVPAQTAAHAHTHGDARGWTRGVVGDARAEGSSYAAPAGADRPAFRATLTSLSPSLPAGAAAASTVRSGDPNQRERPPQTDEWFASTAHRQSRAQRTRCSRRPRGLCPVAATAGALEAFVRNRECAAAALVPLSDGDGLPFVDDADTRRASVGGRHAAGTLWRQFLCGGCATFGRRRLHTVTPLC